ncbi:MAG: OsmC family protein [Acidimicrobiales bacterium]|nr:OsmC family protein [Acidimicrobiales bacterium]
MTGVTHQYRTRLEWSGSTGEGYEDYDRTHSVTAVAASQGLTLSSDAAFRGDPSLLNPEQLLVAAASSCQLLSFLAVAARARLDVIEYHDDAVAVMPEDDPPTRITRIDLHPTITLLAGDDPRPEDARLNHLVEVAHRSCYIANSLRSDVQVHPTFRWTT